MAVRRTRKIKPEVVEVEEPKPVIPSRWNWKKWRWLFMAVSLLAIWWWKTNTWPVVAVVNWRPITRYEVSKTLYSQGGDALVDSLITQRLVEEELDRRGVAVDEAKVNEQLDKMKQGLPQGVKWEDELASRGFTEKQIRNLIGLQLRLATAVEGEATVAAEEVAQYVKTNGAYLTGKTDDEKNKEAGGLLKQDKIGTAIEALIAKVREEGMKKVWRLGK